MKLVINIPCYNEQDTLPQVLAELPNELPEIDEIFIQIIDDGSLDRTTMVAQSFGFSVIRHKRNLGLGRAFQTGADAAIANECDIFVNLDADNQYPARYIQDLIHPIQTNQADIVIGNRIPWKQRHFSIAKRMLQWLGNGIIKNLLNIDVPDVISGFRAYSRPALEKLYVTSSYSYTLDTLVQAVHYGLKIKSIEIKTNPPTRRSRLSNNIAQYIVLTLLNFTQVMLIYEPQKVFLWGILTLGLSIGFFYSLALLRSIF